MKIRQQINMNRSVLRPLHCAVAVYLTMALGAPLYAAQAGPQGPSGQSSQKDAGESSLPLQAAVTAPAARTAPSDSPALTTEQYNEMLETLRTQVAQQRALLQVLAQRAGTLPDTPAGTEGTAASEAGAGTVQHDTSAGRQDTPTPDAGATSSPVPVTPSATPEPRTIDGGVGIPQSSGGLQTIPETPPEPVAAEVAAPAAKQDAVKPVATESLADDTASRQAYASGVSVWREIQNSVAMQQALGIHLDPQLVLAGLEDSARGQQLKLSEQAITDAMSALNVDYQSRAQEERKRQDAEGKAYRVAFSKEKGSFSDAGAWYRIVSKGTGRRLSVSDMVQVKVTGTLPDGSVFDASGSHDQVRQVKVGALLPSVAIGLQKIGVGGQIIVVVPPAKGYGDNGLPPAIPGGATLIFDVTVERLSGGQS